LFGFGSCPSSFYGKHGRIAMLVLIGPYHDSCRGAIFGPNHIPIAGIVQIIAFGGIIECAIVCYILDTGNDFFGDSCNGWINFGWDLFTVKEETKATESCRRAVSQCIQDPVPVLHSRPYYSLTIRSAQDQSCSNQEQ
jgi:hypothetical protein